MFSVLRRLGEGRLQFRSTILNRFSMILLYCNSTHSCDSRCEISGDSAPVVLRECPGIVSYAVPSCACAYFWCVVFLLVVRFLLLTVLLVFVSYGRLVWSLLLTVEIQFGLSCLRWKIGLVFYLQVPPSGNRVRSFLLIFPHRK